MSVKQRLKLFIESQGISINQFEKLCDLSKGYVGNIRVSIQPGKLSSISHRFPGLNTGWLLTGEGEMLKKAEANQFRGNYRAHKRAVPRPLRGGFGTVV